MSSVVVKGATVYAGQLAFGAESRDAVAGDVVVVDGVVTDLAAADAPRDAVVIDADGLVLLPGFVDLHTHLREPGREDAETICSGSQAAAVGGYTAILAMANTTPVTDTAEAAERILDLGRACGLVDVQPIGAVTRGLAGEQLAELGLMQRSRAGVKVFSDDGHCVDDSRVMRRALEYVRTFGGVISQHSQDASLAGSSACCHEGEISGRLGLPGWPAAAESVIIARDVQLARHTGGRVHVAHVSTAEGVEVIRWAKAQGIAVTAEVTPHHLALTTERLTAYDPVFKVNPHFGRARMSTRCGQPCGTGPSTRLRRTTRPMRGTTRNTPSSMPPTGCSAWRRRWRSSPTSCSVRASGGATSLGSCRWRRRSSPDWSSTDAPLRRASRPTSSSSTRLHSARSTPRHRGHSRATTPGTA